MEYRGIGLQGLFNIHNCLQWIIINLYQIQGIFSKVTIFSHNNRHRFPNITNPVYCTGIIYRWNSNSAGEGLRHLLYILTCQYPHYTRSLKGLRDVYIQNFRMGIGASQHRRMFCIRQADIIHKLPSTRQKPHIFLPLITCTYPFFLFAAHNLLLNNLVINYPHFLSRNYPKANR